MRLAHIDRGLGMPIVLRDAADSRYDSPRNRHNTMLVLNVAGCRTKEGEPCFLRVSGSFSSLPLPGARILQQRLWLPLTLTANEQGDSSAHAIRSTRQAQGVLQRPPSSMACIQLSWPVTFYCRGQNEAPPIFFSETSWFNRRVLTRCRPRARMPAGRKARQRCSSGCL